MHLKKKGTILISSVIILSLISILGSLMFKMMRYDNELSSLYNSSMDIYDFDDNEEKNLYEFMIKINNKIKENPDDADIFLEDFEMKNKDSILKYSSKNNELILITSRSNNLTRERQIMYLHKEEKIILVPTFKFIDKNE
ncbi:hypothetical protein [Clostridium sp.]|jgi:hypothetical protein|uniref:hypothetical protein n=1 Tax=Clostridium sp. TaxID=1506 RepID=UPI0028475D00|nr:hypothetical protein [Clostridium sp.]MDR3596791.1 hypothetical protein [Clostridium sp.]